MPATYAIVIDVYLDSALPVVLGEGGAELRVQVTPEEAVVRCLGFAIQPTEHQELWEVPEAEITLLRARRLGVRTLPNPSGWSRFGHGLGIVVQTSLTPWFEAGCDTALGFCLGNGTVLRPALGWALRNLKTGVLQPLLDTQAEALGVTDAGSCDADVYEFEEYRP